MINWLSVLSSVASTCKTTWNQAGKLSQVRSCQIALMFRKTKVWRCLNYDLKPNSTRKDPTRTASCFIILDPPNSISALWKLFFYLHLNLPRHPTLHSILIFITLHQSSAQYVSVSLRVEAPCIIYISNDRVVKCKTDIIRLFNQCDDVLRVVFTIYRPADVLSELRNLQRRVQLE